MRRFQLHLYLGFAITFALGTTGDPQLTSWYTANSGQYARIYETLADEASGNAVTTWSRGQGNQTLPTYAGVHEVSYSQDWIYIRSTGLGSHVMGPWYLNEAKTNLFPNYPANRSIIYRIPRSTNAPDNKSLTGLGAIGYFVDGVAMFDNRDAFSYSTANGTDATPRNGIQGDGVWNRDAYINEGVTFDAGNAHQAGSNYHYHANPPALRSQLGDAVDYDSESNTYTEQPEGAGHSPILGWVRDGFPVYGPYGYNDPEDPTSGVRRMRSGYQKRDGTNGTTNLAATGRTSLPGWAADAQNRSATLSSNRYGPPVNATYILGHYIEDYDYLGDHGFIQATDFDLDRYNGRFCITPDYPEGIYAYFVSIEEDGTPKYPYNIGRQFFGSPTGGTVNNVNETVTIHFEGGPEAPDSIESISPDPVTDTVTLVWNAIEGGNYRVDASSDLNTWTTVEDDKAAELDKLVVAAAMDPATVEQRFFRSVRTSVDAFDGSGFDVSTATVDQPNILLLILDDWGIDSSPVDNNSIDNPGTTFAPMPTLQNLADSGVRFTDAYAQPICSPTRAAILTGRQAFRTGVGFPVGGPNGGPPLPSEELTLPEIFAVAASPYAMASFGKWHLGGGRSGYNTLGGWPEFRGLTAGGLQDYTNWTKNDNGTNITNYSVYSTTDQVNDAVAFIEAQQAAENPWFCWVAFNAPHTPFHNPPQDLHSYGANPLGAGDRSAYQAALEALDTEIGRLLASVDLANTNIILVGDNGTPRQVVQAPYSANHAKGSLYEGGIHVPLIVSGPSVTLAPGTQSSRLVHVVDLFHTILDMADIDAAAIIPGTTVIDSTSMLPILNGTDSATRSVVAEKIDGSASGRSLRSELFPEYKLIIFGDPDSTADTPVFEFYNVLSDENEQAPLNIAGLSGAALDAYNHLAALDVALGGGYSQPAGP
jgi:arylsulfatase A-like enzyme